MRVHSSLLGAAIVLFACVNASSTRSDSTIATSTTPNRHNVPAQRNLRGNDEMNEEERQGFGEVADGVRSMVSNIQENRLRSELMAKNKSVEDAFVSLDKNQLRIADLNVWISYAVKKQSTAFSDEIILEVLNYYGPSGLGKRLEAFGTVEGAEDVVRMVEEKLIAFWSWKNTPMIETLSHLRLDKPTDPLLRKRLLETWVKYGKTEEDPDSAMLKAVNGCDEEMRVAVIEGLREIKGTDHVVTLAFSNLMTSLEIRKVPANIVFKLLKLDQPGATQSRTLHFDAWVKYAANTLIYLPDKMKGKVEKIYGLKGLEKVLTAVEPGYKLIESWMAKKTPMTDAFTLLKLNEPTDPLLRQALLKTLVLYGNKKKTTFKAMAKAIESCDDEIRYANLVGLQGIKGADRVVELVDSSLKTSLEEHTLDVNFIFKLAELKPPNNTEESKFAFNEWVEYAARSATILSEDTIRTVLKLHGVKRFLRLHAAYRKTHRDKHTLGLWRFADSLGEAGHVDDLEAKGGGRDVFST